MSCFFVIAFSLEQQTKTDGPVIKRKPATAASTEALRTLKGVMRVGLLAKNLLLKGDTDVKLIVICSDKPTKKLLERVYELLKEKIEVHLGFLNDQ